MYEVKKIARLALLVALILATGAASSYAAGGYYSAQIEGIETTTGRYATMRYGSGLVAGSNVEIKGRIRVETDSRPIEELYLYLYMLPDRLYKTDGGYTLAPSDEKSMKKHVMGYRVNNGQTIYWNTWIDVPTKPGRYSILAVAVDYGVIGEGLTGVKELGGIKAIDGHPIVAISSRGPGDGLGAAQGVGVVTPTADYNVALYLDQIGMILLVSGGAAAFWYALKKRAENQN